MIRRYQANPERTEILGEVISRCRPIALSLIRSKGTVLHEDEDELLSVVDRKLMRSLPEYCLDRGTAFAFVFRLTVNMLSTTVTRRRKLAARFPPLDELTIATTPDEGSGINSKLALDDLAERIRSIRSSCEAETERQAQRWRVASFLDLEFALRRHEVSNACMKV